MPSKKEESFSPFMAAPAKLTKEWIDPIILVTELRPAIKNRATEVILRGRKFRIKYRAERSKDSVADEMLFIYPEEGFVPCGWFSVRRITQKDIMFDGA